MVKYLFVGVVDRNYAFAPPPNGLGVSRHPPI
jgi:hypothetical protein